MQNEAGDPVPFQLSREANYWHYKERRQDSKGAKHGGVMVLYYDLIKLSSC